MGGRDAFLRRIQAEGMVGPADRRLGVAPLLEGRKGALHLRVEMAFFGSVGESLLEF